MANILTPEETISDRIHALVECDHDVGYSYDYDGSEIFPLSRMKESVKFTAEMNEIFDMDGYGIMFFNYCPKCGHKLNPPK